MDKKIIALVPVKAVSERVPGKNMRDFNGKPLLHYILNTLEQIPEIACVSVNTDSEQAAEYAVRFSKVVIHERPLEIRGGHISMNSIIADELARLEGDHFLQTHATNPLLGSDTIRNAIAAYRQGLSQYDALFSVLEHRSRFYDGNRKPINHDPAKLINTQDLNPVFEENSCLYLFSREAFFNAGQNRLGTRPMLYPMDRIESQDIDTEEDFLLAEFMHKVLNGTRS